MNDKEVSELLKQMLGKNAFNNGMKVEIDFGRLVKAVNYSVTQLKITERFCETEGKEHIEEVIENIKNILKDE